MTVKNGKQMAEGEEEEEEDLFEVMKAIKDDTKRRAQFVLQEKQAQKAAREKRGDLLNEYNSELQVSARTSATLSTLALAALARTTLSPSLFTPCLLRQVDFEILIWEGAEQRKKEDLEAEKKRNGFAVPAAHQPAAANKANQNKSDEANKNASKEKDPFKVNLDVRAFDPESQLEGMKRGAIASEKRRQMLEKATREEDQKRLFKAMPLPGGVVVSGNLHGMTEAMRLKDIKLERERVRRANGGKRLRKKKEKKGGPVRMDAAALFLKMDRQVRRASERRRSTVRCAPCSHVRVALIHPPQDSAIPEDAALAPSLPSDELLRRKEERKATRTAKKMEEDKKGILSLKEEIALLEGKLGRKKSPRAKKPEEEDDYLDAIDGAAAKLENDDNSDSSSDEVSG